MRNFGARELQQHHQRCFRLAMAPHETQRPTEIDVFQEQSSIDQTDGIEHLRIVFYVGDDDLELLDTIAKPRFGRRRKAGIDVERNDAPNRATYQAIESVTSRTSEHCDASRPVYFYNASKLLRDEPSLTNGRERHVRLVID